MPICVKIWPFIASSLVPHRVPPFELGIVVEVFGLARPELDVPWWYSLHVCAERPAGREAVGGFGFHVEHGLEALAQADTIIVPGWHGDVVGRARWPRLRAARRPATSRSAAGRSCSPPPACWTAARPPPTGATPTGSRASTRACG